MIEDDLKRSRMTSIAIPLFMVMALLASRHIAGHPLFHTLSELFSFFVGIAIAMITYYTYRFTRNDLLLYIGAGYFWIALMDMMHLLSYPGVGALGIEDRNVTLTFWLTARIMEALLLLSAPFLRRYATELFWLFGAVAVAATATALEAPPLLFDPQTGLTLLKVATEYLVIATLFLCLPLYSWNKVALPGHTRRYIIYAILFSIGAEFCFTLYVDFFGDLSVWGHLLKLLSYWMLFEAVVRDSLREPFTMMQRDATTYNAIPLPTVVVDPEGIIRQANRATEEFLGLSLKQIIGRTNHEVFHHTQTDAAHCPICRALKGTAASVIPDMENIIGEKVLQFHISPILEKRAATGAVQVCVDMREQKKTEAHLQESLMLLREGQRIAHIGNWVLDYPVTGTSEWSDEFYRICGLNPDSVPPSLNAYASLLDPSERDSIAEAIERAITTKAPQSLKHWLTRPDGEKRYVHIVGEPLLDGEGNILKLLGTVHDVTEQKRAEERNDQLAKLLDLNVNEIYLIDATTDRFTYANQAALEALGYTIEEIVAMTPSEILADPGLDAKDILEPLKERSKQELRFETLHKRKDGSTYPVEVSLQRIQYEGRTHYLALVMDISRQKAAEKEVYQQHVELQYQSQHDPLSGLPNRILFLDRLLHAMQKAKRHNETVAIYYIDIDYFKEINDSFGHSVGDMLLQLIAQRLTKLLRAEDTLSRQGGDEFGLLVESIEHPSHAGEVAEKIMDAFKKPFDLNGQMLYTTCSIGISLYPLNGTDVDTLLKNADAAMYRAKHEGRNTYQFYTTDMTDRAFERVMLENSMRTALEHDEFVVFYQPQIDSRTNRLIGMEALVRWQHPEMGMISPGRFIPLAEETGMIIPLGEIVLRKAAAQAAAWYKEGIIVDHMAVNLSAKQLQAPDLVTKITSILQESECRAEWLQLEVTEGYIMHSPERAIRILETIRELGIRLAMDDFGTGYSSLSYLKRLPINMLKIDQSFVMDAPGDANDEAIVRSIVSLAKSMGLEVLAEGVETESQLRFLAEEGCYNIQGFFYGRPMDATEFTDWFKKRY